MAKYRIAWLPGDGVGNDVMEAARLGIHPRRHRLGILAQRGQPLPRPH
jgi:isocitrate/isopropylmalate dehydrogenase